MTNTQEAQEPSAEDTVATMAQACAQLDAICELLRLSGGAVINTAHVYALLEPLRVRLCNAHEGLDELVQ